jgi:hypothetical protein
MAGVFPFLLPPLTAFSTAMGVCHRVGSLVNSRLINPGVKQPFGSFRARIAEAGAQGEYFLQNGPGLARLQLRQQRLAQKVAGQSCPPLKLAFRGRRQAERFPGCLFSRRTVPCCQTELRLLAKQLNMVQTQAALAGKVESFLGGPAGGFQFPFRPGGPRSHQVP